MALSALFAVDTNFLLDLQFGEKRVVEAYGLIRKKAAASTIIALPTVLDELANGIEVWDAPNRKLALGVLCDLKQKWGIQPLDLIPSGHGLTELAADAILAAGLLPSTERNDAFIVAEAALLNCALLVSSDNHLLSIDHNRLLALLRGRDLGQPSIRSPRQIIGMFS